MARAVAPSASGSVGEYILRACRADLRDFDRPGSFCHELRVGLWWAHGGSRKATVSSPGW